MKPTVLRPQVSRDQQGEARYCCNETAVQLVKATNAALDQIDLAPGIGSQVR